MSDPFVVIMAGGRGERFWPQSRLRRPKHLLPIVGDKPMLAQTVDRLEGVVPTRNIFVITNREQREAVVETVPSLPPENVVAEPVGRDTAAAVGLAALLVKQRDKDAIFTILPADHVIHNVEAFQRTLRRAIDLAQQHPALVTIGIQPNHPATGYGYIELGDAVEGADETGAFHVRRFVEKPVLETAKRYIESGDFVWNAGMFTWKTSVIVKEIARHVPELYSGLQQIESGLADGAEVDAVLDRVYPGLPRISIDYAVMEKAENVLTVKAEFDWDDVGSWPAIARHFKPDDSSNVARGEVVLEDARGNIVVSEGNHLVAAVGVDDLIVIHTGDATLICRKDRAEDIKKVVTQLGDRPQWHGLV